MANASWSPHRVALPGTHTAVIDDILRWIPETSLTTIERIYFLFGEARCGKSSVANRIAQSMSEQGRLGSAIFLARDVEARNHSRTIFSTIAYDLAAFDGKIEEAIAGAIRRQPSLATADIERQFYELVVAPIRDLTVIGPVLLLIDGVDELRDMKDRLRFLRVLFEQSVHLPPNFRILVTSRPIADIGAFRWIKDYHRRDMCFDDSGDVRDVRTHIEEATNQLGVTCFGEHSIDAVRDQLVDRALEIRLLAATMGKFLTSVSESDATLFITTLLSHHLPLTPNDAMNQVYEALLRTISKRFPVLFETGWQVLFHQLINGESSSMLEVKSHFPAKSHSPAAVALQYHPVDMLRTVGCIMFQVDGSCVVRLHPAFQAFVMDSRRCINPWFYDGKEVQYPPIPDLVLETMNDLIVHNICRLEDTSLLNSEVADLEQRINQFVPPPLLYASRHWADHLHAKPSEKQVLEPLREFLLNHLLHWIELSSVTGQVDAALASLRITSEWLTVWIVLCLTM